MWLRPPPPDLELPQGRLCLPSLSCEILEDRTAFILTRTRPAIMRKVSWAKTKWQCPLTCKLIEMVANVKGLVVVAGVLVVNEPYVACEAGERR